MEFEITGYLHKGPDDRIWIARPMHIHGRGLYRQPPYYQRLRLGPDAEARFSRLVSPINTPHDLGDEDLTVIVHLKASAHLVEEASGEQRRRPSMMEEEKVYEIDGAKLVDAEFITAGWREAWNQLDGFFRTVPEATLSPPSREKSERLERLMENASRNLERMKGRRLRSEWEDLVREIDPGAELVTTYQDAACDVWGPPLAWCVEWLGTPPETPLPEEFRTGETLARIQPSSALINPVTVEEAGLVVRLLDRERTHELLILGGFVVEDVLDDEREPRLVPGDVIPARTSWYQVFCGSFDALPCAAPVNVKSMKESLINKLGLSKRRPEKLHVLRGEQMLAFSPGDE